MRLKLNESPTKKAPFEVLDSADDWKSVVLMLYGPPGVGKTWLSATSTQVDSLKPVLLLDNDGGSRTIRGKKGFEGIKVFRINDSEAYNIIFDAISKEPEKYKTIIVDNLGAIHEMFMESVMREVCSKDANREPEVPSQREYLIVGSIITKIVKHFSNLAEQGINVIFTTHAEKDKDELLNTTLIRPALPGKLSYKIPGILPIVGYYFLDTPKTLGRSKPVGNVSRVLVLQAPKTESKDTSDRLGTSITNPDMKKIVDLLKGE